MARRIKACLKLRGLTQADLARLTGRSKTTISRILTSHTWIDLRTIALIEQHVRWDVIEGHPTGALQPNGVSPPLACGRVGEGPGCQQLGGDHGEV